MATQDRSMLSEFSQGIVDNTYIQLMPDRGGQIENIPYDRLTWPTYAQAELHQDDPMIESMLTHLPRPVEIKTRSQR